MMGLTAWRLSQCHEANLQERLSTSQEEEEEQQEESHALFQPG